MLPSSILPPMKIRKQTLSVLFSLSILLQLVLFAACSSPEEAAKEAASVEAIAGDDTTTTTTTDNTTTTAITPNSCPADNWWQLMEGSTSRNVSLFSTPTLSRHTEQSIGRVLYVDKSALSQYQRDDYLLIDPFRSQYCEDCAGGLMCTRDGPVICDRVDLGDSTPVLGNRFTLEARFYYDGGRYGRGQLLGSESFRAPAISFHNHGKEIRYGFYTCLLYTSPSPRDRG